MIFLTVIVLSTEVFIPFDQAANRTHITVATVCVSIITYENIVLYDLEVHILTWNNH